jgi:hypothetical protein
LPKILYHFICLSFLHALWMFRTGKWEWRGNKEEQRKEKVRRKMKVKLWQFLILFNYMDHGKSLKWQQVENKVETSSLKT